MFHPAQYRFDKLGSSLSALPLSLVLLRGETTDNPWGIPMVGSIAGVIAFVGCWFFRGYRVTLQGDRGSGVR